MLFVSGFLPAHAVFVGAVRCPGTSLLASLVQYSVKEIPPKDESSDGGLYAILYLTLQRCVIVFLLLASAGCLILIPFNRSGMNAHYCSLFTSLRWRRYYWICVYNCYQCDSRRSALHMRTPLINVMIEQTLGACYYGFLCDPAGVLPCCVLSGRRVTRLTVKPIAELLLFHS